MKKIETTRQFDKDLKAIGLVPELIDVLHALVKDLPVPEKYKDHALKGDLKQYRECHLRPDLLLAYQTTSDRVLAYQTTSDRVKLIAVDNHNNLFKVLHNRK